MERGQQFGRSSMRIYLSFYIITISIININLYMKRYPLCFPFSSAGKMFKTSDLNLIVEFFLMFHKDKPIDWLLDHILYVKVCNPEKDPVSIISHNCMTPNPKHASVFSNFKKRKKKLLLQTMFYFSVIDICRSFVFFDSQGISYIII